MPLGPVVDPEFDRTPTRAPGACPGDRCDGSGFVRVSEAYVDHWAGQPPSIPEGDTDEDRRVFEAVHRAYRAARAAWRQSSYPCPTCMPRQFEAWAGGHWAVGHNRSECGECRVVDASTGRWTRGTGRRRRKRDEAPPPDDSSAPVDADQPEPEPEVLPFRADLA